MRFWALEVLDSGGSDLVESSQETRLLAGETVTSLDGRDGTLHVTRHQELSQLEKTVTEHKELWGGQSMIPTL